MSRASRDPAAPARRRGRPARLSRERVLRAALALLEHEPPEALTMTRVAAALDTAPMSLYTHVRSRDDLLDGAAALALGDLDIAIPARGSWQTRLRAWAHALRRHVRRRPQVLQLVRRGTRLSAPWLHVRAALVRALAPARLPPRVCADAERWIMQTVLGALLLEQMTPAALSPEGDPFAAFAAVERLAPADRAAIEPLLPHMRGHDRESFFEYGLARILAALEPLARPRLKA
jgi:TetR/AcrR family tetracycline transcriptional repressor